MFATMDSMAAPELKIPKLLIPDSCRFTPDSNFKIDDCRHALVDSGMALISLSDRADADGTAMRQIVEQLGVAGIHDSHGTCIWDVRYDVNVDQETGTRSLTSKEFPLHTDGSFEDSPPTFVALYCVEPDQLGGGETLFADGREILTLLSKRSFYALLENGVLLRVPAEFFKGQDTVYRNILDFDAINFRYRKDIIVLDSCEPHVLRAVEELDSLVNSPTHIKGIHLQKGEIIIFDNGRFFHGRTKVEDRRRHLKRMWFHLKD